MRPASIANPKPGPDNGVAANPPSTPMPKGRPTRWSSKRPLPQLLTHHTLLSPQPASGPAQQLKPSPLNRGVEGTPHLLRPNLQPPVSPNSAPHTINPATGKPVSPRSQAYHNAVANELAMTACWDRKLACQSVQELQQPPSVIPTIATRTTVSTHACPKPLVLLSSASMTLSLIDLTSPTALSYAPSTPLTIPYVATRPKTRGPGRPPSRNTAILTSLAVAITTNQAITYATSQNHSLHAHLQPPVTHPTLFFPSNRSSDPLPTRPTNDNDTYRRYHRSRNRNQRHEG